METRTYTVLSQAEAETLVAQCLGVSAATVNLAADLSWNNDTVHSFELEPPTLQANRVNHEQHLADARAQGAVQWNWELAAVLTNLADRDQLPYGFLLIEICW